MPMNWNSEADAKLFLGVLAQFDGSKPKLDFEKLAQYMGSDCTACAVQNRVVRLRRMVESADSSTTPTSTPSSTPRKRKGAAAPKTPTKKSKVVENTADESDNEKILLKAMIKKEIDGDSKDDA
ncbi:hypothetical protein EYZ11_011064 [Aspergillus tanneri]|uniref:Myb-like domain-containing protein n=1 Tax=Aspergillus tanneri TaxID=1220188 RepID=A0A4S3J3T3_9EURO|nr:uncharacterized protein ATNIH1004_003665 [Aspergillus tanneri]KAA8650974.1 hypothetical protein ATNIH1004_003665 [Aspergillus tanneri]THC89480.1 hypothetical protein EYZ11_011064 [Aspergillus tanneri]